MYTERLIDSSLRQLRASSVLLMLIILILGVALTSMADDGITQADPDSKGEVFQVRIQAVRAPGVTELVSGSTTTLCLGEWIQLRAITSLSMAEEDQVHYQWDLDGDGNIDMSGSPVDGSTLTTSPGSRRVTLYAIDRNNPKRMATDVALYQILNRRVPEMQAEAIRSRTRSFFYVGMGVLILGALAAGLLAVDIAAP